MKYSLNLTWLAAMLLFAALTGCKSELYKSADLFAEQFVNAWCAGDSVAVRATVAKMQQHCDSVEINLIPHFNREFSQHIQHLLADSSHCHRDAVIAADFATAGYNDVCLSTAERITSALLNGELTIEGAMNEVRATRAALTMLGQPQTIGQFHAALDLSARNLPLHKQMQLFSSVASPQALARALRADFNAPEADTALVRRQIGELRKIYSAEQFDTFISNFRK